MAQETYAFFNTIGAVGGAGNYTVIASGDASSDPLIEADGNINGSTPAGGTLVGGGTISFQGNANYYFLGYTTAGDPVISLLPSGTTGATYVLSNSNLIGQSVTFVPGGTYTYCFCSGTGIATPSGEALVEDLAIGDLILAEGGRIVSVKWIGRQTVMTRFGPAERLMPVRFAAGALGEGLPHSDLTVTADHGMLVDGVICHAGALVNGSTITRVPLVEMDETYTVYHIETDEHEIILANGAPAETFIDNVSRRVFDNFAEFEALYGDVPEMEELPYPRAMSARQVPGRIVSKLAGKAVA